MSHIYLKDTMSPLTPMKGRIRVYPSGKPNELLYAEDNVITLTVKSLFARLMASSTEPAYGIWGLSLGTGDPSWGANNQPVETALQTAMQTQLLRKPLSSVTFVDSNFNPVSGFSNIVDFQTTLNATTDNIAAAQIREMGLIGGGHVGVTNMLTAPYWDPTTMLANSVTMVNYKTLPPLILPPGISIDFSWAITF